MSDSDQIFVFLTSWWNIFSVVVWQAEYFRDNQTILSTIGEDTVRADDEGKIGPENIEFNWIVSYNIEVTGIKIANIEVTKIVHDKGRKLCWTKKKWMTFSMSTWSNKIVLQTFL